MQETSVKREEGRHFCVKDKRTRIGDERWEEVRGVDDFEEILEDSEVWFNLKEKWKGGGKEIYI